jgi:probable F420-dependent oxidoreductase
LQFGIHLPHVGPFATADAIAAVARHAEELGFHSVWASDHIITPRNIESTYPGGRYPVLPEFPFLEPVSTLLFAAAVTSRVQLGTSVLVVPQRQPVLLAKQLATLDVLSGGRLIFGAGTGWMREEFEALNVPFEAHGPRLDDYLEVIKRCWTEDHPTFDGRFYDLPDIGFYPKPSQKPHPPIWVGGWAEGALRRVARFGDAWHAMGPPDLLANAYARIKGYAAEYGRDPEAIGLTLRADGVGRGEPAETIEQLRAYAGIGVSMALMTFVSSSVEAINEKVSAFMRDVAEKV